MKSCEKNQNESPRREHGHRSSSPHLSRPPKGSRRVEGFAVLLRRPWLRIDPAVWHTQAAFVSAGGYHHHSGLNTWESLGGSPPPPGTTGLYHTAILYPTRRALAVAMRRVIDAGIHLDGASDHGVSEALYLRDPDVNGVELYWDRPKVAWPRSPEGDIAMFSKRLDVNALLKEFESGNNALTITEGPQDL